MIPIQNIYYLLCYAWDKLEEKERVKVAGVAGENLVNLFARIFVRGLEQLQRVGLERGYVQQQEVSGRIRGKIDFGASIKQHLFQQGKVKCTYDDFQRNILPNQLIKSTICRLLLTTGLAAEWRQALKRLETLFYEVDVIPLRAFYFDQVRLQAHQQHYAFLLKVGALVASNLLPTEQSGRFQFASFWKQDQPMQRLFEKFIYNFYRYHLREIPFETVKREYLRWDVTDSLDEESIRHLPRMQTDASLISTRQKRRLIIETKFTPTTFQVHYQKESVRSEHLYQLFAYLQSEQYSNVYADWETEGLLLYPRVKEVPMVVNWIKGKKVRVCTINLHQEWEQIEGDLLGLVI